MGTKIADRTRKAQDMTDVAQPQDTAAAGPSR
jgi:hypothetical protein